MVLEITESVGDVQRHDLPRIERLEASLLELPQLDIPVEHFFAPGVYMRQVRMPKDAFVIGHCHKTEHLNVVISGRATVMIDGVKHEIVGPCTFKSGVNVRKVLYIREPMIWATVHPTHETNLDRLEEELIVKSDAFLNHAAREIETLQSVIAEENNQMEGTLCHGSQ